jgi:hypothetical protein
MNKSGGNVLLSRPTSGNPKVPLSILVEKREPSTSENTKTWYPYGPLAPSSGALTDARILPFY